GSTVSASAPGEDAADGRMFAADRERASYSRSHVAPRAGPLTLPRARDLLGNCVPHVPEGSRRTLPSRQLPPRRTESRRPPRFTARLLVDPEQSMHPPAHARKPRAGPDDG